LIYKEEVRDGLNNPLATVLQGARCQIPPRKQSGKYKLDIIMLRKIYCFQSLVNQIIDLPNVSSTAYVNPFQWDVEALFSVPMCQERMRSHHHCCCS
jgi:hypothetical protein